MSTLSIAAALKKSKKTSPPEPKSLRDVTMTKISLATKMMLITPAAGRTKSMTPLIPKNNHGAAGRFVLFRSSACSSDSPVQGETNPRNPLLNFACTWGTGSYSTAFADRLRGATWRRRATVAVLLCRVLRDYVEFHVHINLVSRSRSSATVTLRPFSPPSMATSTISFYEEFAPEVALLASRVREMP